MSNVPSQPALLYAQDEDILVHAGGDFAILCPPWQCMASGTDGAFAAGSPWTLTSASVDFEAYGVHPNQVVWLTAPKNIFPGGGHFLAVDSVAPGQVTLRRPYKGPGVGQPPAPAAGLNAVAFSIPTLDPQIAEATYDLNQRFGVDPNPAAGTQRSPSWIYDLQVLRVATVYAVLLERYTQETRTSQGDFEKKAQRFAAKLDDAIARIQIRWGQTGADAEPSTILDCQLVR